MGDLNAYSTIWGAQRDNRGREVVNWATARNLKQYITQPTWRRRHQESTLDLVFTNSLTQFTGVVSNLTQLGSDHLLISGFFTCQIPGNLKYMTPDRDPWARYLDEEKAFSPTHYGDAYKELVRLSKVMSRTKTSSYRRKKWWDDEVT